MIAKFLFWTRTSKAQPVILGVILIILLFIAFATYRSWRILERVNNPELAINSVYLSQNAGFPLALVAEYQNAGWRRMDWLEVKLAVIRSFRLEDAPQFVNVVRANPTIGGVKETMILEMKDAPLALAFCTQWLGEDKARSTSQWYYVLDKAHGGLMPQRYLGAVGNELVAITNLQPCG